MNQILLLVGMVIVICILTGRVTSKLAVPSLLFFIGLGMLFGVNGIVRISFDDYQITEKICSAGLIFIIFYGGFGTNLKEARPVAVKSILMSTVGVALTAGLVGVFAHYILHISWMESFLVGSVISSTDAASVFNILRSKKLDLKYHTASLLELESGSNDPVSYMLTILCISLLSGEDISIPSMLFLQVGIGILCGVLMGKAAVWALHRISFTIDEGRTIFTVAAMILSYAIPQMLGGNGYLSVYLSGILMGNSRFPEKRHLVSFFDAITGISQMMIFFLLGLLVTPVMLPKVFLQALLIMLFMTFFARPLASALSLLPFRSDWRQIAVVSWAGLRGAASIVFAIMAVLSDAPLSCDLFNLVFCVVLLSIALQGTLLPLVSRKVDMIDGSADVRKTFNDYEAESSIHFVKTKIREDHIYCNRYVKDILLPSDMLIVMVLRKEEKIIPNGDTLLKSGDWLILAAPEFFDGDNLVLHEQIILKNDKWNGKHLKEIQMPKGNLVVSIQRKEKTIIPTGDTVICEDDILIMAKF